MPTQAKKQINFKNAICLAVRITGEPCAVAAGGKMGSAPSCQHPRRAHPTSAVPQGLCLHREQTPSRENCPEKGRALPDHQVSSLPMEKGLCWRVWFGSWLAACPPCHSLAVNLPQLFLQQLDAALSSSKILQTVSFPKSVEKALGCSSRSDFWGAFPSSAPWM